MIRQDMYRVLEIEKQCFGSGAWNQDEFIRHLRIRNTIGMVAELDDHILGYMVYALHKATLELLNLGVDPKYQRSGVGSALMEKLKRKIHAGSRSKLVAMVSEHNLAGQLFFRSQGLRCTGIEKNFFDDTDLDAYRMELDRSAAIQGEAEQTEWRMQG